MQYAIRPLEISLAKLQIARLDPGPYRTAVTVLLLLIVKPSLGFSHSLAR